MTRKTLSTRTGVLFLLPAVATVAVFLIGPALWVISVSFTNRTLTGVTAIAPRFVGLANYRELFNFDRWLHSGEFGSALLISLQFVLGSAILGQAVLGLGLAWLFYRRGGPIKELVYTLAILAWIIPDVVVAFTWVAFLDRDFGTLNALVSRLGLGRPDWLLDYPLFSIILFNTWRGTAFSLLLFSSALATIPPSYLETAEVSGASGWQKLRDVVAPFIAPHIFTDLILITLWTFNTFTPYLLTGGGPAFRTELVSIFTYRVAFKFFRFGQGAAVAVTMMVINLCLASLYLLMLRRQERRATGGVKAVGNG